MADHERHDAERPAEAHREHGEQHDRHAAPPEGDGQHGERQHEGEHRRALAVPEGGRHLVVREHGGAREAGAHARELGLYPCHRRPQRSDRVAVGREAPVLPPRLDQDEEQPLVVGEEVAGIPVAPLQREERPPRRAVGHPSIEPRRDLIEHVAGGAEVDVRIRVVEPQVEGVADEGRHDLRPQAVDQLVERRPRREGGEEPSMIDDVVGEVGEVVT